MTIELPVLIREIKAKKSLNGNRYAEVYFNEVHNDNYNDAEMQMSVWEKVYWNASTHASGVQHYVGRICRVKLVIRQVQEKRNDKVFTVIQATIIKVSLNSDIGG